MKPFLTLSIFVLVALLAGVSACSSIKVSSSLVEPNSFSDYQTYAWVLPPDEKRSVLYENEIMAAVDQTMEQNGYKKVKEDATPDLHMLYQTRQTDKIRIVTETRPRDPYTLLMDQHTSAESYSEGALLLALEDNKTKKLVWRGIASNVVDVTNRSRTEKVIHEAVEKLLKKLPSRH